MVRDHPLAFLLKCIRNLGIQIAVALRKIKIQPDSIYEFGCKRIKMIYLEPVEIIAQVSTLDQHLENSCEEGFHAIVFQALFSEIEVSFLYFFEACKCLVPLSYGLDCL
jgi:hypothetical protein